MFTLGVVSMDPVCRNGESQVGVVEMPRCTPYTYNGGAGLMEENGAVNSHAVIEI